MAEQRLILAIGRIERALSRIEQVKTQVGGDEALIARHQLLKSQTREAIREIDELIAGGIQ